MAGSLFERLTMGHSGLQLSEDESIRLHLARMLTTRQGAVQALPDYGLPDLNDLSFSRSELLSFTCKEIERCITLYEPRLVSPTVTYLPIAENAPFTMNFMIRALKVDEKGHHVPWSWKVTMEKDQLHSFES